MTVIQSVDQLAVLLNTWAQEALDEMGVEEGWTVYATFHHPSQTFVVAARKTHASSTEAKRIEDAVRDALLTRLQEGPKKDT